MHCKTLNIKGLSHNDKMRSIQADCKSYMSYHVCLIVENQKISLCASKFLATKPMIVVSITSDRA